MIVDGNKCKPLYAVGDIFNRTPKQKDNIPKRKRKRKKAGFGRTVRVKKKKTGLAAPVPSSVVVDKNNEGSVSSIPRKTYCSKHKIL